jgi:small subunit ribosomal protein S17
MADQENPETTPDAEPPAAEEAPAPEAAEEQAAPEAQAAEAEAEADVASEQVAPGAPAAAPSEPQAPQLTPQERRVAARAKRGRRRASTPEERFEMRKAKASARSRRRQQERAKKTTKGEGTPPAEHGTGTPAVRMGKVVSDKADKTITVRIDIAKRHRRYRKIVRSSSTLHAHDERNDANEGDLVRVVECRPMSRTKRWRLAEILERAK